MSESPSTDARIASLAARQLGVITGDQASDLGLSMSQIKYRVTTGRWRREARGIYLVAGAAPSWRQGLLTWCMAGPPGTVGSFRSAAAAWNLGEPPRRPQITVPRRSSGRLDGAEVHRSDLDRRDVTRVGPIPVTRVPRTLVDLGSVLAPRALERAVDTALDRALASPAEVHAAIDRAQRAPGRHGVRALRRALAAWTDPIRPESPAEARLLRRISEWGLPAPVRQHVLRDHSGLAIARLDVAWPQAQVGLEYDGLAAHGPRRIEADEIRHAAVEALGWDLVHADRLDLRPGDHRLPDVLRPLLTRRPAA